MSVYAAENGQLYALSDHEWLEFLGDRANGLSVSISDYGIGVAAIHHDVTHMTPALAAALCAAHPAERLKTAA